MVNVSSGMWDKLQSVRLASLRTLCFSLSGTWLLKDGVMMMIYPSILHSRRLQYILRVLKAMDICILKGQTFLVIRLFIVMFFLIKYALKTVYRLFPHDQIEKSKETLIIPYIRSHLIEYFFSKIKHSLRIFLRFDNLFKVYMRFLAFSSSTIWFR